MGETLNITPTESVEIVSSDPNALVANDEERTLSAGETLEIPRGTVHSMWNASANPAQTIPAGRPALGLLGAIGRRRGYRA